MTCSRVSCGRARACRAGRIEADGFDVAVDHAVLLIMPYFLNGYLGTNLEKLSHSPGEPAYALRKHLYARCRPHLLPCWRPARLNPRHDFPLRLAFRAELTNQISRSLVLFAVREQEYAGQSSLVLRGPLGNHTRKPHPEVRKLYIYQSIYISHESIVRTERVRVAPATNNVAYRMKRIDIRLPSPNRFQRISASGERVYNNILDAF